MIDLANSPSVLEPGDFDNKRMLPEELTGSRALPLAEIPLRNWRILK
jgi:hypothetical protein